ncbi:MAG: hypothetical protein K2M75_02235 [Clostridia bacterium]|nr:hypothetical protein [Clostridia bacterium]
MQDNIQKQKVETVKVKKELDWYIVLEYLESIKTFCPLFQDEEFCKIFEEMREYVEEKIDVPNEIVDKYIVVEYIKSGD